MALSVMVYSIVWQGIYMVLFGRVGHRTTLVCNTYCIYGVRSVLSSFGEHGTAGLLTVSSSRSRCLQIVLPGAKDLQGCSCISFARNDIWIVKGNIFDIRSLGDPPGLDF